MEQGALVWEPPVDARFTTRMGHFWDAAEAVVGRRIPDHEALWRWSVDDPDAFWRLVADQLNVHWDRPPTAMLADRSMPGALWAPTALLNHARHALARTGDEVAVVHASQTRDGGELTWDELREAVARCRTGLARLGVGTGDRVVAYLPNVPETLVAFLATASLGAIWSSCAPEFGVEAVVDRVTQIEPTVLLAVDGYRYGDRAVDRRDEVARIRAALPTLQATIHVPYLDPSARLPDTVAWADLLSDEGPLEFQPVPFDHPLYVLYSSGTTGTPKAIIHGHGGITLEHMKALALHHDLGPGRRFMWFTTTGWMMWNYLVSGLTVGASIVLFDGDPGHPDLMTLWRLAEEHDVAVLGVSAPFLMACRKAGLTPGDDLDMSALRSVGSTGAPLPAEGFGWVRDAVGPHVQTASVSGGTDVCTAFVVGSPLLPVHAGEISCRALGCDVHAWSDDGDDLVGERGELVITTPMPSMPVGFWGDEDGSRYRAAYFDHFPGTWRHGDWITVTERGSCVITGRSDATLNRGGVRSGTVEYYAAVEDLPEVTSALVVHLEDPTGETAGELLLFVATTDGVEVDDDLRATIARTVRERISPRHVPDAVVRVPDVPRTLSGKKLEVPVKRLLLGDALDDVAATGALANPQSLDPFVAYAAAREA